jgi:hypothetical protein
MACGIQPSEIDAMTASDLIYWLGQAARIHGNAEP